MKKYILLLHFVFTYALLVYSQEDEKGIIAGRVYNNKNNEPVPFASVVIWGTSIGSITDIDGNFLFTGIKPGYVELRASSIGFETYISSQILVTNANKVFLDIPLTESSIQIDEVEVKASAFRRTEESPVSLRRIGIEEIEKNPGGNRDISRVIQSFPGVSSSVSFRNDVIVRGGGSSENRFYLDDVEIPTLNHFSTQGASGGPVGIINVDFIREVDFYSGAFPADRGNALSSVINFKQVDGNKEKLKTRATIGASDLALTLDGPVRENTTFVFSARRSYLQFLFSAIGLPFLPTYNDFQFKTKTILSNKNEITFIGLGALDQFALNKEANETPYQRYILGYIPVNEQWNYTFGGVYKHYRSNGYDTWVISRSYLNNVSYKYKDNIEVDSLKTLDYRSTEAENKFRYENNTRFDNGLKTNWGVNLEYAQYTNDTYNKLFIGNQPFTRNYSSDLDVIKWGLFSQASQKVLNERLTLSMGIRADANNFNKDMSNLFKQLSPRFSASYLVYKDIYLNFNTGRYYQLPPYTTLGFRDENGTLVNKENHITYIVSDHIVTGFEWLPSPNSKLSIEGFFKLYHNYPFSITDSISIASKGADFGTYGDEAVLSIAEGRSYGAELYYRNKDLWGFNLILSYTWVRSEFKDMNDDLKPLDTYIPTSWDNKHLLNITATRSFKKNWDLGFKWRFVGGAPYTPYDLFKSSLVEAWDARAQAYLDYSRFNQERLKPFHQLDVRVDKQYFFNKWSLMLYLDIQNLYNFKSDEQDIIVRTEDGSGNLLPPSGDPLRYPLEKLENEGSGTVLPTIGIMVEF
ncbi:MAG: TonB-dependent receptor [Bacteroidales bacterium]|nr:TonB-dependent receptor [Bacteroidales bacterium]